MLWFEGSIPDAINSAKQRNCIFVVVITGQDEQSAQLMSSWEDDRVSEETRDCCVAIKVDSKSDSCVQFSQIYPVVCVPSSFFIGENGIPLEVIAGSVSAEELIRRIRRVKQMHVQHIAGGLMSEVSAPVETTLHGSTEPGPASAPALPISSAATEPAVVPGSLSSTGGHKSAVENPSSDHLTQDEENLLTKDERLTKKMESQEKKKTEAEKEIKRRKLGKDFQDFKRKQEEEKTKRLLEERNREQVEEKAARERVKQQIALDRAERAARYAKTQEEEKAVRQALLQAGQAEQEARKKTAVSERSNKTRIQFRLPDGSSFTNQFPSQSRLQEARQFALQEVGNQYGNFSMATMFPRRVFTGEDLNKTLLELELTPSASIVLLPQLSRPGNAVMRSSDGGIWAILGTLLYPLLAVWRFLSSFLFATRPVSRIPTHQTTLHTSLDSDKAKRETRSTHSVDKQPKDFKKDGNICRLRTQEDSEEDNTTWNGNSTQQM